MYNISFDMETSDPDDVFTLCWLAGNPKVNLRSVTVTPGSLAQIGLVKFILQKLEQEHIPVGSKNPEHPKECVSGFHYKWLGKIDKSDPDGIGGDIIENSYKKYNDLKIICGASLGNISKFLDSGIVLDEIFIQGGFAGDSVVPKEYRLEKFDGKETCATFNLNGDVNAALKVVATNQIKKKYFISKNVCHGFVYDYAMHERMLKVKSDSPGFNLMVNGMSVYLKHHPSGKAFHDPLAACTAINKNICEFAEVELYRQKGEWGSKIKENTNTFISINASKEKFEKTLSMKI